MFCISALHQVAPILLRDCLSRVKEGELPEGAKRVRVPLCFLFVRERADIEKDLMDQVDSSYRYWFHRSGSSLDVVLPGWDENQIYQPDQYAAFESDLQTATKWRPQATTSALLLDYVFDVEKQEVKLDFSECMCLPLGEMIEDKKIRSLDTFMTDLINVVVEAQVEQKKVDTYRISDLFAQKEGLRVLGTWLQSPVDPKKLLAVFYEFRPYAICDLRKEL